MSAILDKFRDKFSDKRVMVVTSGLPSKRSFLLEAFKDMCRTDAIYCKSAKERRIDTLLRPIGLGRSVDNERHVNDGMIAAAASASYDLICVIKGLDVRRSTIEAARAANKGARIVLWTPDDQALPHNQSATFLEAVPAYDMVFTTKSNNVKYREFEKLGFRQVAFLYQAYSEHDHFPLRTGVSQYEGKVIFIGYAEEKRFDFMNSLAEHGVRIEVFGNGWNKLTYARRRHANLILHRRPLLGRDYAEALSNAAIDLCFLREKNRDLHTSRSFEIPACGGFMLAERTSEHETLFSEGREAEFFGSKEELLEKVRYYLDHPEERTVIAANGYRRTRADGYSYHHMVERMMTTIFAPESGALRPEVVQ
jgi:hypothetical protein